MQNAFTQLGGTCCIYAAMIGFAFHAHHVPAAFRTALRHVERFVAARMVFIVDDFNDFGNYVATALDHHPVADLYFQTINLILIVERGPRHRRAADGNGLERGHRSELAGAAHLDKNVFDPAGAAARGVLISNGPARGFSGEAEPLLRARGIFLDDDAINFVTKLVAHLLAFGDELQHLVNIAGEYMVGIDFESKGVQRL